MKSFLTLCLLLISTAAVASAQQKTVGSKQEAVRRAETRLRQTSLTRAQTREAERRLSALGYWTGAVDGLFDPATRSALITFQKWEGRAITGQLTLDELEAIRTSSSPKAREPGYGHIEVDLDRQCYWLGSGWTRFSNGSSGKFVDLPPTWAYSFALAECWL